MKIHFRALAAIALVGLAPALFRPMPLASSEHFVITNDNELTPENTTGTILKLESWRTNPTLSIKRTMKTKMRTSGQGIAKPTVQVLKTGTDTCVFLSDSEQNDNSITSFKYFDESLVGNYNDPAVQDSSFGIALAAHGNFIFAGYGDNHLRQGYVGVWQILPGCGLTLLNTYEISFRIVSMGITPNGKTLLLSLAPERESRRSPAAVDSFSIAQDGSLTEHGPYIQPLTKIADTIDVDITKDSKYAIFSVASSLSYNPVMEIYKIRDDGSLRHPMLFVGLGPATSTAWISLSPDERFLYLADSSVDVITLQFTEDPLSLTFGCVTKLPQEVFLQGRPTTALPTGAGGDLYIPQVPVNGQPENDSLVLLSIDPATGCTTQVAGSQFSDGHVGTISFAAPWPPRPF
jgi:hypothetical protein